MNIREFSRAYTEKSNVVAFVETLWTVLAYLACIALAISFLGTFWVVPFTALAGVLGVRIYMLQHDCMHNSLFESRLVNDVLGTLLSPVSLTPYQATKYNHNLHHAHVGNIEHREAFEIDMMTVAEFQEASRAQQLWYRFYRSPFTLVFVGPFVLYTVLRRFPRNGFKTGIWWVVLHNALLLGMFAALYLIAGWGGVLIQFGAIYVATVFGAIIPYVVHNFEEVYWGRRPEYTYEQGALQGSSVLDFGPVFDFLTANIGYHDLHHLNANIPCYRLKKCYLEAGDLLQSRKISLSEVVQCYRWKLYDEQTNRMVGWDAVAQTSIAVPAE
ncbi:MAG: fatty acid desaturase [Pseudomonadota bacterium]